MWVLLRKFLFVDSMYDGWSLTVISICSLFFWLCVFLLLPVLVHLILCGCLGNFMMTQYVPVLRDEVKMKMCFPTLILVYLCNYMSDVANFVIFY